MTQDKLACPFCGGFKSEVLRTQPARDLTGYDRRRRCLNTRCRGRFWTVETIRAEKTTRPPSDR